MTNILLIISFTVVAVFGFFVMGKLDKFLAENRKSITRETIKRKSDKKDKYVQKKANPAEKEVDISEKTNDK